MSEIIDQQGSYTKEISREFFKNVYSYMFGALAISGILAYYCGNEAFYNEYFASPNGGVSMLFWIVLLAPLGLSFLIQGGLQKFTFGTLLFLFILFSALMGMSLSVILLRYSTSTLASTFFITSGAFASMAILGYTTKTDLSKMGSMLYMALFGLIIASFVQLFIGGGALNFIIGVLGVFIFTGLTAYHMQSLKEIAADSRIDTISRQKLALMGGLQLYLLFVNLFLSLLRLVGGNRD